MDDKQNPLSREEAVKQWEQENNASLVAGQSSSKLVGVGLIVATVLALGLAWYVKNSPQDADPTGEPTKEVSIAEKKPLPELPSEAPTTSEPPKTETPVQVVDQQAEQARMQKAEQERRMAEARLKSSLLVQGSNSAAAGSGSAMASPQNSPASMFGSTGAEKGAQDANSKFARSVSGQSVPSSHAKQITNLESKILQGKLIEAVLEPRAISDLPGMLCAVVQRDVYAHKGRNKLIPWGSKVCGIYSGDLRKGQERLFVVWNTLRRPDGIEVTLDSVGSDQLGSVGLGGQVDTHFAEIFGMSALLSIIGAGASTSGVQSGDQYNSESYYRQSVQQAAAQTVQQVLQPYANIPPTVTVPAGAKVRIYVNRDLDFSSVMEEQTSQATQPNYIF